jgi:glycosyltransferase involved in cell wall biosynthesis
MPSFNHAKFIDEAIRSVLRQTISDLELIVVDDCSVDGSREIILRWAGRDSRVRTIFHEINVGIAKTVNDGCDAARGKYVCFIASDDMYKPDAFEKALRVLEVDAKPCAVILNTGWIDEGGRWIAQFSEYYAAITGEQVPFALMRGEEKNNGALFNELACKEGSVGVGLIRRSALKSYDVRFDERLRYANDNLFWLELSRVCHFAYIEEPLYLHRIHRTNTFNTARYRQKFHADHIIELQIILSKYRDVLSNVSRGVLLKNLAKSRVATSDFRGAKECLAALLAQSQGMLNRSKIILILLFVRLASRNRNLMTVMVNFYRKSFETFTAIGQRRKYYDKLFRSIWQIEQTD